MTSTAPHLPGGRSDAADQANTDGYGDGTRWSGDDAHRDSAPTEGPGALVVIGYLTAALIPLVGFILGIVVATRPAKVMSKHGAWIILVSIVAFVIYVVLLSSSGGTTTDTTTY